MTSLFDRYLQESDAFSAKTKTPELSRSHRMLKMFLMSVNFVFLIFACALIGVGSVAFYKNVGVLAGQTIPQGIIALGVFIMILSFFGCIGAWKENRLLLGCYFLFLFIFTILLLAVGIGVMSKKDEAGWYMSEGWKRASLDVRASFQNGLGCCGLEIWNVTSAYPFADCPITIPAPAVNQSWGTVQGPCLDQLVSAFNKSYSDLGGLGIAFAVIMFLGMVAVCYLTRAIRAKADAVAAADNEKIDTGDDSSSPTAAETETPQP